MQNKGPAQRSSTVPYAAQKKTKSRNGCQRCKLKRLKCGEEKPGCKNCDNRGIPCPGYKKTLKWSRKYEWFQPEQLDLTQEFVAFENVSIGGKPLSPTLSTATAKTPDERRYPSPESETTTAEVSPPNGSGKRHDSLVVKSKSKSKSKENADAEGPDSSNHSPIPEEATEGSEIPSSEVLLEGTPTDLDDDTEFFLETFSFAQDDLVELQTSFEVEEVPRNHLEHLSRETQARRLLQTYYRLQPSSPSAGLTDDSSHLVRYYFTEVCGIYSSFDSDLNPFRKVVGNFLHSSPSIFFAIQSMSAAQLANRRPGWATIGTDLQRQAYQNLNEELDAIHENPKESGKTMLAILLLGLTTAWHKSDDLGEAHLQAARNLIIPKLLEVHNSDQTASTEDHQFYEESLIYWEMLMGFVTPANVPLTRPPSRPLVDFRGPNGKVRPHSWTGVAPHIQMLFAEVGRLVRWQRQTVLQVEAPNMEDSETLFCHQDPFELGSTSDISFTPDVFDQSFDCAQLPDLTETHHVIDLATELEEQLLSAEVPTEDEITDIHDSKTTKQHFIAIAEAYRTAGLLELYRVFPSLLHTRLGNKQPEWTDQFGMDTTAEPVLDATNDFGSSSSTSSSTTFLNSLAMHILETLARIPETSGTLCIQPILLLTAASELRQVASLDFFDPNMFYADARISKARRFADHRFSTFARKLPEKPMLCMKEVMKEVWRRADAGWGEVFWLDVMMEKGWQTVMG